MSDRERAELVPLARQIRGERRKEALQLVIDAAKSCALEQDRGTDGHEGRLRQREDHLCGAIREAYEALHEGPVTEDELVVALAAYEAGRRL
jgi:hypothetical protein